MAVAGLWAACTAALAAELSISEIWCLQPGNRVLVVRTAVAEGTGAAAGENGGLLLPEGSTGAGKPLDLEQWREDPDLGFESICDRTYESLTGIPAAGPAAAGGDDVPWYVEVGVNALGGGLAALLGGAAGYWVRGRERKQERKYQRALAVADGLGSLNAALKGLPGRYREGSAESEHWDSAKSRVTELEAKIPTSPKAEVREAKRSLAALSNLLRPASEGERETRAAELQNASNDVNAVIGKLVQALSKEASGAS